jgi:hypothetical protein
MKKRREGRSGAQRFLYLVRFSETMPVTALPPDNTPRWWLDYVANGDSHSMLMRAAAGKTAAEVSTVFSDFLGLFTTDNLFGITVTGLRHANEGSDVSLPETYTGTTAFGSGTAVDTDNRAKTFSFTGRDIFGHKVRLYVYGAKSGANGNYRIDRGESFIMDSVEDYLNALDGFWETINGSHPIWNLYANTGFNDHWIRRARG